MNNPRRKALEKIRDQISDLREQLEELRQEEEEYRDNIPENLQTSERYEKAENAEYALSEAVDNLDFAIEQIDTAME